MEKYFASSKDKCAENLKKSDSHFGCCKGSVISIGISGIPIRSTLVATSILEEIKTHLNEDKFL